MAANLTALIPHYKVMLFVGNLDMLVGPAQVNKMLENPGNNNDLVKNYLIFNLLPQKEWKYYKDFYSAKRVVWKVSKNDPEVSGYAKSFGQFIEVLVRNAGHSVHKDQPRSDFDMIRRFIYNFPFES